jgi:integrase
MSIKKVKTTMFPSGVGYRVDFHRRGKKRIRRVFETRGLAQRVLDQLRINAIQQEFGLPVDSGVTINDLIEHHLEQMVKRERSRVNIKRATTILNRFAQLIGRRTLVEKIKRSDLRRYVELRMAAKPAPHKKKGPGNSSINREVTEIKSCLSAATSYYPALEDWQPPKGVWLEEAFDGRRQTWSNEEIADVLRELYAPRRKNEKPDSVATRYSIADMFRVALATGMRAGEVKNLHKQQIDFKAGVILVTSKKGMTVKRRARTREVPMTDEVVEILKRRADEAKGEYLFPGRSADKPMADYRPVFKRACERVGIDCSYEGLIFNDARRTAENRILEAGHSARAVGDIFGHSAETMARNYARSTREQRRAAVESAGNQAQAETVKQESDGWVN